MDIRVENYTFNHNTGVITFTDYTSIELAGILLIVNETYQNTILYNFADATKGGTVATNALTLNISTSAMADTDKLFIKYSEPRESIIMQNAATGSGNGNSLNVVEKATAIISIVSSVAMSGGTTITFEASVDDTTWISILAHQIGSAGVQNSTSLIDGAFRINCSGFKSLRARISAYSAGTITIVGYATTLSAHPTTIGIAGTVQPLVSKTFSQIIDWTTVAQNTIVKTSALDCSGNETALLHIQRFLDTTTAHLGTRFLVQVSANSSGDEDWQDYAEFIDLIATAVTQNLTNNPAAIGNTVLTCSATTGFTTLGTWRAIKDATLINSELFYQIAYTASTNITILDGLTNSHVQNTPMWNVAGSSVILLDSSILRVRVVIDNTYSPSGSTVNYKARVTNATSL